MNENRSVKRKGFGGKLGWLRAWLVQIACAMVLSLLGAESLLLGGGWYNAFLWGILPVAGCIGAYRATVAGLLNYAAWIAPPIAMVAANVLRWGFSPNPGPICLCAFVSLVGAAAGEVVKRSNKKK